MKDTTERQMSESIISWILLSFSGGAMDAHSYLFRGSVFSNAQTGNILLFGVNLATGDSSGALKHLWPIMAFMIGIFLADRIRYSWHLSNRHWRQDAVGLELGLIFLVALMPNGLDPVANALLSLACGIQVESFRSVRRHKASSTMLVGNLRSFTSAFESFIRKHSAEAAEALAIYMGLILSFVLGAICESLLIPITGKGSAGLCVLVLAVVFVILYVEPRDYKQ